MDQSLYELVRMDENLPMRIIHLDSAKTPSILMNYDINTVHFIPPHWHRSIEFTYVVKGGLELRLGNETRRYSTGEFLFVNSGDIHEISNVPGIETEVICFIISYEYLKMLHPKIDSTRFDLRNNENTFSDFKDDFLDIVELFNSEDAYKHLYIRSKLDRILYVLFKMYQVEHSEVKIREFASAQNSYKKILEYIHENYDEDISLDSVAKANHRSREHFSRRFKEVFGKTFLEYLIDYRIYRAFPDVVNSEDMIEVISRRHGFPSSKGFITQFKRRYKMTPNAYRKAFQISIVEHKSQDVNVIYSDNITKRP